MVGISCVVSGFLVLDYNYSFTELSVTTTTKERKSYIRRRVPKREEEHDYPKILLIGEEMVEL